MSTIVHGLVLTAVGMGLVFLALGVFLAVMLIMPALLRERAELDLETTVDAAAPSEAEMAAIGAALAIWTRRSADLGDEQLGASLAARSSPWGKVARERSHSTWK